MKHTLYLYEYVDRYPTNVGTDIARNGKEAKERARTWVNRLPYRVVTIVRTDGRSWSEANVNNTYLSNNNHTRD